MMMPHEKGTFIGKLLVPQQPKAPIRDSESLDKLDVSYETTHVFLVEYNPCAYGVVTFPEHAPSDIAFLHW